MSALSPIDFYSIFSDIKVFLYGGFQTLPFTMGGTLLLLGLFTANYAALFFLFGFFIITPILTAGVNKVCDFFKWSKPGSDVCTLIAPFPATMNLPTTSYGVSYWMTMVSFLFGYLITNAVEIYKVPIQYPSDPTKATPDVVADITNKAGYRKSQMVISLLMLSIVLVAFLIVRISSKCDNPWALIAATAFAAAGCGWFFILSIAGQKRLSDLFGIANRLMDPNAMPSEEKVCLQLE